MSDPMKSMSADDLLSSIRRLVTNEVSQALDSPILSSLEAKSVRTMRPALLLTPDFRVKAGLKNGMGETVEDMVCDVAKDVPIISHGEQVTASPDDKRRQDAGERAEKVQRKTVSNAIPEKRHPGRDMPDGRDTSSAGDGGDDMRPLKNTRRQKLPSEMLTAESYYEDEHVELPGREASLVALREALTQTPGAQPVMRAESEAGFETGEGRAVSESRPQKMSTPNPAPPAAAAVEAEENTGQKFGKEDTASAPVENADRSSDDRCASDAVKEADRIQAALNTLDEPALRDMVGQLIRQELQGPLGARITRNVRKLVRREVHRALASRDFE